MPGMSGHGTSGMSGHDMSGMDMGFGMGIGGMNLGGSATARSRYRDATSRLQATIPSPAHSLRSAISSRPGSSTQATSASPFYLVNGRPAADPFSVAVRRG
jgi:hypothetical protein